MGFIRDWKQYVPGSLYAGCQMNKGSEAASFFDSPVAGARIATPLTLTITHMLFLLPTCSPSFHIHVLLVFAFSPNSICFPHYCLPHTRNGGTQPKLPKLHLSFLQ